jgi:hypothetical protein
MRQDLDGGAALEEVFESAARWKRALEDRPD